MQEIQKEMWKTINKITNKKSKTTNITKIVVDDKIIEEPEVIANTFNNYFNDVGTILAQKLPESTKIPEAYIKHENGSTFESQGIMEDDVFSMVSTLPSSKAMGYDRISHKLLKDSVYVITSSLTYIFNQSLLTGMFPNDLKVAIISPIF